MPRPVAPTVRPITSACYAPHAGLYLRPDGVVLPCCANARPVGTVTGPRRQSLLDIWRGERHVEVRRALEADDFRLGCDGCIPGPGGGAARTVARAFDGYASDETDPAWPRHLDLALSNTCNLQCVMCNGDLSSAIRTGREGRPPARSAYDEAFFTELRGLLPHLETIHFKGGEPFLSTEVGRVWDDLLATQATAEVRVTTNGTHLTERGAAYVRDLRMHVLVSIDAIDPDAYRAIRIGAEIDRVLANLDRFQQLTSEAGASTSLVFCLMDRNVDQLRPVLLEAERRALEVEIIWVDSPAPFDLRRAAPEHLAQAVAQLEAGDATVRSRLSGGRRHHWDDTLQELRRLQAEAQAEPVGVPISITTAAARDLEAELADAVVGPILRAEATDGIWRSVDAPPWASPLDPSSWIGASVADTITMLWSSTGASVSYDTEVRADGVREARIEMASDGGTWVLRALVVPGDGGRRATLLLGSETP